MKFDKTAVKKPVMVEFAGPFFDKRTVETIEGDFEIDEEYLNENDGYVIIKGVEGEVYPCSLSVFKDTYNNHGI